MNSNIIKALGGNNNSPTFLPYTKGSMFDKAGAKNISVVDNKILFKTKYENKNNVVFFRIIDNSLDAISPYYSFEIIKYPDERYTIVDNSNIVLKFQAYKMSDIQELFDFIEPDLFNILWG